MQSRRWHWSQNPATFMSSGPTTLAVLASRKNGRVVWNSDRCDLTS
jgi:hypothetical protein